MNLPVPEDFLTRLDTPETSTTGRFNAGVITFEEDALLQLVFTLDEVVLQAPVERRTAGFGQTKASITAEAWSSADGTPAYTTTLINNDAAYKQ